MRHGIYLSLILLCISMFFIYIAYKEYNKPVVKNVVENVKFMKISGRFYTESKVLHENPIWNVGEVLKDKNIYFYDLNPVLNFGFIFISDRNINYNFSENIYLEYSAFNEILKRKAIYKNSGKFIGNLTTNHSLNISSIKKIVEEFREKYGISVNGKIVYFIKIKNKDINFDEVFYLNISLMNKYYKISGDNKVKTLYKKVVKKKYYKRSISDKRIILPIIFSSFLISVSSYLFASWYINRNLKDEDVYIKKIIKKYRKWISMGRLPKIKGLKIIPVKSVEDIIEAAVDSNKRVIFDSKRKIFFFIDNDVVYIHKLKYETKSDKGD